MKSGRVDDRKKVSPSLRYLYSVFTLMAILSWVGLDFLDWCQGKASFFFGGIGPALRAKESEKTVEELVLTSLLEAGIPASAINRSQDGSGTTQMTIRLPLEVYASLAPRLERQILEAKVLLSKQEKESEQEEVFVWEMKKTERDKLSLLFSCPRPIAEEKQARVSETLPKKSVAIIIDDMGFSLETVQQICDMKIPITIAILPLSPFARETAQLAHQNSLEIILHLPGESLNHQEDNGNPSNFIRSEMAEEEIRTLTEDFLARVPFIQGVNNHMGSKITQEPSVMRPILELIAKRRLYFIDSRTSPNSVAFDLAKQLGIPSAYRHIFLDTTVGIGFSKQRFIELLKTAQKTGRAVGIGHPFPETLRAIQESIPLFKEYGVEPVHASQIVR